MQKFPRFNSSKVRAFVAICAIAVSALVVGRAESGAESAPAASMSGMSPEQFDSLPAELQEELIERDRSDTEIPDLSLPVDEDRSTWKSLDELLKDQGAHDDEIESESVDESVHGPGGKAKKPGAKTSSKKSSKKKKKHWVAQDHLDEKFVYTTDGGMRQPKKRCELFMNAKGDYNSYGRIVKDYILEDKSDGNQSRFVSDNLVGMTAMPKICPNWTKFDDATKIRFWVWVLADIAYWESDCWAEIPDHRDVTGRIAVGMYQLEGDIKLRGPRGDNCAVSKKAIHTPYSSIRCAMDMLRTQLKPSKTQSGRLYSSVKNDDSYFFWLRQPNGGAIGRNIRYFTPCRSASAK